MALTRGGSPTVDLMVGDASGEGTVSLQVKTSNWAWRGRKRAPETSFWQWDVGVKARTLRGESIFYAFVDLRSFSESLPPTTLPQVFIVPSKIVADALGTGWSRYMFSISHTRKDEFYERWDLITSRLTPVLEPSTSEPVMKETPPESER